MIRIRHRNDLEYRKRHPSLHYYVWEQLGPNAGSVWVILSAPERTVNPLTLNCLEMWSAVTLQTLPKTTLMRYLPGEIFSPRAGCHLNVSSPLSQKAQSFGPAKNALGDLYMSDNPILREYYRMQQKEYHTLRCSDDLFLRNYWWDSQRRGIDTRTNGARNKNCIDFLTGVEVKVHFDFRRSIQEIYICGHTLKIRLSIVKLDPSEPLLVQCYLADDPDNDRYALDSRSYDDASRLVIRMKGKTREGRVFDGTAYGLGERTVFKLNAIYDTLVGRSLEESRQLPRRYFRPRKDEKDI